MNQETRTIEVLLKYFNNKATFRKIQCVSKPSLRKYRKFDDIGRVLGGLGMYIVSTPRGVFTDHELRERAKADERLGGEVLVAVE